MHADHGTFETLHNEHREIPAPVRDVAIVVVVATPSGHNALIHGVDMTRAPEADISPIVTCAWQ